MTYFEKADYGEESRKSSVNTQTMVIFSGVCTMFVRLLSIILFINRVVFVLKGNIFDDILRLNTVPHAFCVESILVVALCLTCRISVFCTFGTIWHV